MKKSFLTIAAVWLAWSAVGVEKGELDQKIAKMTSKFLAMQQKPDKRVPPDVLTKAEAIILLDRTKAGFIFAYQGGSGVALVRDKQSRKWGPVAFYGANEGSFGLQIGGQQSFMAIVMMNSESTRLLTDPSFEFGGEARGTAGDQSSGVEGGVSNVERAVLVYDDRAGLYGGAAIKGGALSPDEDANRVYYGQPITVKEILFEKKVKATEAADRLARALDESASKK